ncbi:MAG TPA: hypothetical protein VME01_05935 [Solirubrobacteraceae bacterium]|nr:hypothetical protein [Solirubrobacteraceae bacterium]
MSRTAVTTVLILGALWAIPAVALAQGTATATAPTTTPTPPPSTSTPNTRADRTAMNAYANYLEAVVNAMPSAKLSEQAFEQSVNSTCKAALEPIASAQTESGSSSSNAALYDLGEEIGADATLVEFTAANNVALQTLSTKLTALHWGARSAPAVIKRYLTAQKTLSALPASRLCADAEDVGSQTTTPPAGTTAFLLLYKTDSTAVDNSLRNFMKLLDSYETSNDSTVVVRINTLAARVTKLSAKTIANGALQLETDLGLS